MLTQNCWVSEIFKQDSSKDFESENDPNFGICEPLVPFMAFTISWSTALVFRKQLSRSDQIWNLIEKFDRNKFDTMWIELQNISK